MNYERIAHRLLDLQSVIIQLINIERYIALPEDSPHDYENDAEHSYSLAMLTWYLSSYFPELNKDVMIRYALAHDWVEVHAGDVMAIGRTQKQQAEKDAKEKKAIQTLKSEWPDFSDMTDVVEAYFYQTDDEAVFVRTLDKLMGVIVNTLSEGRIWHEKGISRDELLANKDGKTKNHKDIHAIWKILRQHLLEHPEFFPKQD